MLSNLYTLSTVVTPAGTVNQISAHSVDSGFQELVSVVDGQTDPTFAGILKQNAQATFSTSAIARALGFCGWDGLAVTAGVSLYMQKAAQGGLRTGGSAHLKFTFSHGMLVPRSISADDGGVATIDYMFAARTNDGTTSPLSIATAQALPSAVLTREFFTAGKAVINGTTIPVSSVRIDFGHQLFIEGADGDPWPSFIGINQRVPKITITSPETNLANSLGFSVLQSATDSLVYLRKLVAGGLRTPDATAEHISFSIDDGMMLVRSVGGNDGSPQRSEVELCPTFDGTNNTLVINTATAIT
jgi:hypothetical protein